MEGREDAVRDMRKALEAEYQARCGGEIPAGVVAALNDYDDLGRIKGEYLEDVRMRGVVETVINGKQRFRRENKSVAAVSKIALEQIKILKAIGLVRASRAADGGSNMYEEENDFDSF